MQWFAAAAARLDFGKGGATGPGFQPPGHAAGPLPTSGGPSEPFLPRGGGGPGSPDRGDGISAALRSRAFAPDGSVKSSRPLESDVEGEALSAARGDVNAQYRLGLAYRDGKGAPRDPAAAANWLLKAANGGQPQAQIALAAMLESGAGVAPDLASAYKWYDLAASSSAAPFIRDFARKERDRLAASMGEAAGAAVPTPGQ
jgi:TPR repeat protein